MILAKYKAGIRRQLVCLPTGTGKTVIFAEFPRFFKMKNQMLVLAHREELLDQAHDKIKRANNSLKVAVEQAGRTADPSCDVVIASIPTLGRRGSKRLKKLDPEQFLLIVVDEAHHAVASTYRRVLEYFGIFREDCRKLLVGFTATPKRGDGIGLDHIFQEIVFSRNLPEMIQSGYLSPVAGYRVETDIDLSNVKVSMGDFVSSQLSGVVNIQTRNDLIVSVYRDLLQGRPTLCFCVDVAHAHALADAFQSAGIQAAAITGETDRAERTEILRKFHAREVKVLANCMVLTEGYDEPKISGIILARPTKSSLLYTQMIGRGTRLDHEKDNVIIIDIVDSTRKHSLVNLPSLFGLSPQFNLEGRTTSEVDQALRWVEKNRPWVPIHRATSLSDLRVMCTRVNLFDLRTPEELHDFASFAWVELNKGAFRLSLSDSRALIVGPTIMDNWEVVLRTKGVDETITQAQTARSAIIRAEDFVRDRFQDQVGLVSRNTRWRSEPASAKQIKFLSEKKIDTPQGLTKGQASHLISMLTSRV
ncbi:DEAD/DEAH box helicase [bacterium]|nr:DEAD/DEAH box helicase [bacterium]